MFTAKKTNFVFWSRVTAVAVVFFPLSIHHVDFRSTFNLGVSVSAHKSSPAYAAFEDLRENYASEHPQIPEQGHLMAAGTTFNYKTAQKTPTIRLLAMKGMTIRQPPEVKPQPFMVAGQTIRRNALPPRVQARAALSEIEKQALPLAERKRQIVETLKQEENWAPPTAGALAQELAQAELVGVHEHERILRSSTGNPIIIRRSVNNDAPPVASAPQAPAAKIDVATVSPPPALPTNDSGFGFTSSISTRNPNPGDQRPLWLSGQVEMTDGLAFLGSETQIVIRRTFNGQNFESGRIWITEGKFEIHVKRPMGFLVAELQTRDGRVLGRGEVSLIDLKGIPQQDNHITDVRIALHPTTEGASFHAISGYSYGGQKLPVADARVEIQAYSDPQKVNSEGMVSEPTLSRDSSFVARALAKNHWASLVVGQAQEPQDIRLFANNLVDALMNLNLNGTDKKEAYKQSIVWGQVTRDGKPVAGASVEMAGDYTPIYFSEMYMPDIKMPGTSANGLFAFIKVRAGVQAVRVKIGNKIYPAQVFPTEDKHVSYVEVGIRDKVISQFKVFDGLNMNKPVIAQVRLVGTDETLPVAKDDFVEYSVAANPFMVEADGGSEYEISRVTMTGSPHVVHIPLVNRDWLYQLSANKGISPIPRRGTVVGYMDGQDFEVELTGYAPGEVMQIIYFDAQGKPLETKTGIAGGGFAIFNAPQGLQTLYVHPVQSRETFSQVIVAEPQFVQVVTH
ncbi:MAG: hypothetical protein ACXVA9_07860 [Bdellovibrionales bacterium]